MDINMHVHIHILVHYLPNNIIKFSKIFFVQLTSTLTRNINAMLKIQQQNKQRNHNPNMMLKI
jgi:hypothetical protein